MSTQQATAPTEPNSLSPVLDLKPRLVIAFTLGTSGTQGTIDEARRRGIPVEVVGAPEPASLGSAA